MTHLDDRYDQHSPQAEGVSAKVETSSEVRITTPEKVCGMGHRMKRKEDPRFIQGKGNYVDDVKLPGMLYMDIVRSPYAHARILKIDSSEALAMDGVVAVITGEDLKAAGDLHWRLSNRFSVISFRALREGLLHLFFPAGQVQVLPAG